jgi:type II secretory pathway pseudopilin PulG
MRVGRRPTRGFTLLMVLALTAVIGVGLMLAGPLWREQQARERERQWLRIGNLYAHALTQYIEASPGSSRQGPAQLEELLSDPRFLGTRRHMRQLYGDPLQPGKPWAPVLDAQGRIVGVRSMAQGRPFVEVVPPGVSASTPSSGSTYAGWLFMARPVPHPDYRKTASR